MTHPNSHEGRHQSFPDATGPLLSQLDKCRALYEHSPIAIELYNRDGVLEGVNDSCLQLFGIAGMEEILGFSLFSDPNLTSENKDKLRAGNGVRYRGPFDFGLVRAMKLYNTSRSGVIWLDVQITPFAAGEEGGGGFLVQIQDITEQISTERALQESEEKFRHLYDNAPVGLYRSTPDGRILLGNRMICQMLGFNSFEELSARNLEESGFGEQSDRSEFIRQIETTGEVRDLESNWLDSKGSVRVVRENARVVRDAEGRTICYEGSVEDITDARRIEKALRETEKKYQRIASNIKDAVYSVDGSNGEYSYLSPAFRDLTGYSEEDIAAMGGRMAFLT